MTLKIISLTNNNKKRNEHWKKSTYVPRKITLYTELNDIQRQQQYTKVKTKMKKRRKYINLAAKHNKVILI